MSRERLVSLYQLRADSLPVDSSIVVRIQSLQRQIDAIENSSAYHGMSPLNEPGVIAPPNPETLAQHSELLRQQYQLELEQFLTATHRSLANEIQPENRATATQLVYRLTVELWRYNPQEVRQDLGANYVRWLETAAAAINVLGRSSPLSSEMITVLSQHLDVTEEFVELNQRLKQILAPAILGLSD